MSDSFLSKLMWMMLFLVAFEAEGQVVLSENEVVTRALANSKNLIADSFNIRQQQQLVKSSVNLPNPEFFWESPTGNFYTGSITQSIEFPSVYTRQRKMQRARVTLAGVERKVTEMEIRLQIRQMYLQMQTEIERLQQLAAQDSLYEEIQVAAKRQFDAGQIDYMQQLFAESQYGEVHSQYLSAEARMRSFRRQMQYIAAITEEFQPTPLQKLNVTLSSFDTSSSISLASNSRLQAYRLNETISEQNIGLQRSKALPGLAFGYFNQGERETPFQNRFRFGLTIPLWFWQYTGNIQAAKSEWQMNRYRSEGYQQQLGMQYRQLQTEWEGALKILSYYENTGLRKADEMIRTAGRLFQAGETDYINYLRNITEAYNIRQRYVDALSNYNDSVLQIQFLTGEL